MLHYDPIYVLLGCDTSWIVTEDSPWCKAATEVSIFLQEKQGTVEVLLESGTVLNFYDSSRGTSSYSNLLWGPSGVQTVQDHKVKKKASNQFWRYAHSTVIIHNKSYVPCSLTAEISGQRMRSMKFYQPYQKLSLG